MHSSLILARTEQNEDIFCSGEIVTPEPREEMFLAIWLWKEKVILVFMDKKIKINHQRETRLAGKREERKREKNEVRKREKEV